jgi:hypothetical protein
LRRQLRGFLSRVGLDIEDRYLAAFFRKPQRDGASYTLATTGDDRNFSR